MSVNSHLTNVASKLIITDNERTVIDNHITALRNKIDGSFASGSVTERFAFGSYTRKTLMPRKADDHSDVDYMVVFKNSSYTPSTYLTWLKNFANDKYSTSEIYQSHPTIVLELSKIKIELVPAIKSTYDDYQIPAPSSSFTTWLTTHPNSFNTQVTNKNTSEKKLIRPLIRLMKYWNAKNGYVYSSFQLEQLIINQFYYSCQNVWDYLFTFVNGLSAYNSAAWKTEAINRLKTTCTSARNSDSETEIKKAFPEY